MSEWGLVFVLLLVVLVQVREYQQSPLCQWCRSRHRGRCVFNPRSGRLWANANDGHYNYDDPNQ